MSTRAKWILGVVVVLVVVGVVVLAVMLSRRSVSVSVSRGGAGGTPEPVNEVEWTGGDVVITA